MQQLARKFDATFAFDYDTVVGAIDNPDATPLSVMQEALADGFSGAAALVDFQARAWPPAAALVRPFSHAPSIS
jgi:hypothetical protein